MNLYTIVCSLVLFLGPPLIIALWLWDAHRAYWAGFDEGRAVGYSLGKAATDDNTHERGHADVHQRARVRAHQ